jgi:FAD synthetase
VASIASGIPTLDPPPEVSRPIPNGTTSPYIATQRTAFVQDIERSSSSSAGVEPATTASDLNREKTRTPRYRPAYELVDGSLERAGRASGPPRAEQTAV